MLSSLSVYSLLKKNMTKQQERRRLRSICIFLVCGRAPGMKKNRAGLGQAGWQEAGRICQLAFSLLWLSWKETSIRAGSHMPSSVSCLSSVLCVTCLISFY